MSRAATKPKASPTAAAGASIVSPSSTSSSLAAAQQLAAAATQFAATQKAPAATTSLAATSSLLSSKTKSSSPSATATSELLPYALLSKEEQKLFQTKFRAAQKSPHLVEIQIKALDGLIAFLKQKRATAGAIIQASHDELEQIRKDEISLHLKFDPIDGRMRKNMERRNQLMATKAEAQAQMSTIMSSTNNFVQATHHKIDKFKALQLQQDRAFQRFQPATGTGIGLQQKKGATGTIAAAAATSSSKSSTRAF